MGEENIRQVYNTIHFDAVYAYSFPLQQVSFKKKKDIK